MALNVLQYGEQFASNVLKKFYARAITPTIANTEYEGEIKKFGDKVNILMFLEDIKLGDYAVGTNMATQHPVDTEAQLQVNYKKYYNFDIDTVDKQFTYVTDEDSTLIDNASKMLEKVVDLTCLRYAGEAAAGNRVGGKHWAYVVGDTGSYVTITTSAASLATGGGGVITLTQDAAENYVNAKTGVDQESSSFPVDCEGRGIRICSDKINTPWFKITSRVSSTVIYFGNWDGSVESDANEDDYVKHIFKDGGLKYGGSCAGTNGWGCQIEGMRNTQVTSTNVYGLLCDLSTALDNYDVPQENRHISVPPWFKNTLVQASQLQPDIAMYHEEVVRNGLVGRAAGFDVHMVSDDRFSTKVSPMICFSADSDGDGSKLPAMSGYKILANHTGFITFAHSFSESRVKEAILQFANLYQGLNIFGFKVLPMRRKCGAVLFGYK